MTGAFHRIPEGCSGSPPNRTSKVDFASMEFPNRKNRSSYVFGQLSCPEGIRLPYVSHGESCVQHEMWAPVIRALANLGTYILVEFDMLAFLKAAKPTIDDED